MRESDSQPCRLRSVRDGVDHLLCRLGFCVVYAFAVHAIHEQLDAQTQKSQSHHREQIASESSRSLTDDCLISGDLGRARCRTSRLALWLPKRTVLVCKFHPSADTNWTRTHCGDILHCYIYDTKVRSPGCSFPSKGNHSTSQCLWEGKQFREGTQWRRKEREPSRIAKTKENLSSWP